MIAGIRSGHYAILPYMWRQEAVLCSIPGAKKEINVLCCIELYCIVLYICIIPVPGSQEEIDDKKNKSSEKRKKKIRKKGKKKEENNIEKTGESKCIKRFFISS